MGHAYGNMRPQIFASRTSLPCKQMLRIVSVIAQALPSLMSATDPPESADTKLVVREREVSVVPGGTINVEVLERVDAAVGGM